MTSQPADDGVEGEDERWMDVALEAAAQALTRGEVPVGAVVVRDHQLVAKAGNARETRQDPTAHAEVLAMREAAARLQSWRLAGCTVYATLEPCAMCAGALVLARVQRLVYGTADPKAGAVNSLFAIATDVRLNHRVAVTAGVRANEAETLLKQFFSARRRPRA
jgi:tRNA(adenine34) deaminase